MRESRSKGTRPDWRTHSQLSVEATAPLSTYYVTVWGTVYSPWSAREKLKQKFAYTNFRSLTHEVNYSHSFKTAHISPQNLHSITQKGTLSSIRKHFLQGQALLRQHQDPFLAFYFFKLTLQETEACNKTWFNPNTASPCPLVCLISFHVCWGDFTPSRPGC